MVVNGQAVRLDVDDGEILVTVLRDRLALTGTAVGCDTAQCGACAVLLNGSAVKSCTVLAGQVHGADVVTVEGLGTANDPHPMQLAFLRHAALQCGYCTPGMLIAAVELVNQHGPDPDDATIREGLSGNICRCTGYASIVAAIADGAQS